MKKHTKPPSRFWFLVQPLVIFELFIFVMILPFVIIKYSRGEGQPVLVIPGFLLGNWHLWPMKMVLKLKGYNVYGCEYGISKGYKKSFQKRIENKIEKINKKNDGRKVTLIGYSLGGIYARLAAHSKPGKVKQVITSGTPFMDIENSVNIQNIYRFVSGQRLEEDLGEEKIELIKNELPVPNTTIYSYFDGIVSLESCIEPEDYNTVNKEVLSTHLGLPYSASAVSVVLETLDKN